MERGCSRLGIRNQRGGFSVHSRVVSFAVANKLRASGGSYSSASVKHHVRVVEARARRKGDDETVPRVHASHA